MRVVLVVIVVIVVIVVLVVVIVYLEMLLSTLIVVILLLDIIPQSLCRSRFPPVTPKQDSTTTSPPPKPVLYNVDALPPLKDVLTELDFMQYIKEFLKLGYSETRFLLRMASMDFRLLMLETSMSDDDMNKLKAKIAELLVIATIKEPPKERPELQDRLKLNYGRMYVTGFVQSFEYLLGTFGKSPDLGLHDMVLADPDDGCLPHSDNNSSLSNKIYVVKRGNCTFMTKATLAAYANASVLLVINNQDRVESFASGYGIDPNIKLPQVEFLNKLAVAAVANSTWPKLDYAYNHFKEGLSAHMVQLKCGTGGSCYPLTDEEKQILPEVSWGTITITMNSYTHTFDFLASTFGGLLPTREFVIIKADPFDACEEMSNDLKKAIESLSSTSVVGVLVTRGTCKFDVKAANVQAAGARLMIVTDPVDNCLQRVGGMAPETGYIGIPSILVTRPCAEFLENNAKNAIEFFLETGTDGNAVSATSSLIGKLNLGNDTYGADEWIDIAYTEWADDVDQKLLQIEGLIQVIITPYHHHYHHHYH